jgi:ATP adenylyltransferase
MKPLWAPWRMDFILQKDKSAPKSGSKSGSMTGCIFCSKPKAHEDRKNYILYRGAHVFVMLNIYPYNNGHLLISPYLHTGDLSQLDRTILTELMATVQKSVAALEAAVSPEGFNIGINLGKAAGAGIEDHLHIHIVPRWAGDTNYMPVLSETRVIPEHLDATYDTLLPFLNALKTAGPPAGRTGRPLREKKIIASKKKPRRKAGSR